MTIHPAILPKPDPESQSHSDLVLEKILTEISNKGPITFARYMELALYAPGLGYYCVGNTKFGKEGDFVTAPEISPLFARCLANQCQQVLSKIQGGSILELGAGSGQMASDLLLQLETQDSLPEHYFILDISPDLKYCQKKCFEKNIPHLLNKIEWISALPNGSFEGIILANEVVDAMPVHRFKQQDTRVDEFYVTSQGKTLAWSFGEPSDPLLAETILTLNLPAGYTSEINLAIQPWLHALNKSIKRGIMVIIDYGYLEDEYYHPQRTSGTLTCFFRHHAHDNPLILPGIQDITSHANFTLLGNAGKKAGFKIGGYCQQARFLMNCGLLNLIDKNSDPVKQFQLNQQIKQLIFPTEMGQLFKAMALTKEFEYPLLGFSDN